MRLPTINFEEVKWTELILPIGTVYQHHQNNIKTVYSRSTGRVIIMVHGIIALNGEVINGNISFNYLTTKLFDGTGIDNYSLVLTEDNQYQLIPFEGLWTPEQLERLSAIYEDGAKAETAIITAISLVVRHPTLKGKDLDSMTKIITDTLYCQFPFWPKYKHAKIKQLLQIYCVELMLSSEGDLIKAGYCWTQQKIEYKDDLMVGISHVSQLIFPKEGCISICNHTLLSNPVKVTITEEQLKSGVFEAASGYLEYTKLTERNNWYYKPNIILSETSEGYHVNSSRYKVDKPLNLIDEIVYIEDLESGWIENSYPIKISPELIGYSGGAGELLQPSLDEARIAYLDGKLCLVIQKELQNLIWH